MMRMLVKGGYLDAQLLEDEDAHTQEIIEALYRALKDAPSRLLAASLVDAVGEYPLADGEGNPVSLDNMFDLPRVRSLAAIMNA